MSAASDIDAADPGPAGPRGQPGGTGPEMAGSRHGPAGPRRAPAAPRRAAAGDLPSLPLAPGIAEPPCATEPCSQCCHDIEMVLTEADLERLGALEARARMSGTPFPEDWHFEADDGFLQLPVRDGPPARGSPGGRPCVFLGDDGRCTVWQDRPEGCRLYPAVWDEALRDVVLDEDYCPHTDGFAVPRAMHDATRRLAERLQAERRARMARR